MAVQNPASKMQPITSQELSVTITTSIAVMIENPFFIVVPLGYLLQKLCRYVYAYALPPFSAIFIAE